MPALSILSTVLPARDFLQLLRKLEVAPWSQESESHEVLLWRLNRFVSVYLSVSSKDTPCITVNRDTK